MTSGRLTDWDDVVRQNKWQEKTWTLVEGGGGMDVVGENAIHKTDIRVPPRTWKINVVAYKFCICVVCFN